jgi:peptidoglycan/xylan/chitin deacetylase (PgdA/CDA1 family)
VWRRAVDKLWKAADGLRRRHLVNIPPPGMVSFTFDDAPESAFSAGAPILESRGMRGTFYVCASLFGRETDVGRIASREQVAAGAGSGHEIGNHALRHVDLTRESLWRTRRDVRANAEALEGFMTGSFAFPFGGSDARVRCAVGPLVESARGVQPGVNRGPVDFLGLRAVRVYQGDGLHRCMEALADCVANGGWLIYYTHDVCADPSRFGIREDSFAELVGAVAESGARVETVAAAVWLARATRTRTVPGTRT